MNHVEFETSFNNQVNRCASVLFQKAEEYSLDEDRLHNFRVSATMQGVSFPQALAGMMSKHTTSIYDMVKEHLKYSEEMWREKITDHLNYLFLLMAILEEDWDTGLREG